MSLPIIKKNDWATVTPFAASWHCPSCVRASFEPAVVPINMRSLASCVQKVGNCSHSLHDLCPTLGAFTILNRLSHLRFEMKSFAKDDSNVPPSSFIISNTLCSLMCMHWRVTQILRNQPESYCTRAQRRHYKRSCQAVVRLDPHAYVTLKCSRGRRWGSGAPPFHRLWTEVILEQCLCLPLGSGPVTLGLTGRSSFFGWFLLVYQILTSHNAPIESRYRVP